MPSWVPNLRYKIFLKIGKTGLPKEMKRFSFNSVPEVTDVRVQRKTGFVENLKVYSF